ncbi:hypothetical protein EPI10_015517 [Gossypium australe]|uniref:Uncharacterized protein n=1 Tax=Gossypium australe TaxID=47621 RepID=A0A5B6VL46_9ROSI|nr:hypothetical protein EPI10_015517 [Gossypium australe]
MGQQIKIVLEEISDCSKDHPDYAILRLRNKLISTNRLIQKIRRQNPYDAIWTWGHSDANLTFFRVFVKGVDIGKSIDGGSSSPNLYNDFLFSDKIDSVALNLNGYGNSFVHSRLKALSTETLVLVQPESVRQRNSPCFQIVKDSHGKNYLIHDLELTAIVSVLKSDNITCLQDKDETFKMVSIDIVMMAKS